MSCYAELNIAFYLLVAQVKGIMLSSYVFGAIAQLGERLRGTQEVGGSIPPSSTKP